MKTDEMIEMTYKDKSGELMDVEELIGLLEQLGVSEENCRVLALLPLVFMAWADGKVQRAERKKILEVAASHSFINNEESLKLLKHWLHNEPTTLYFDFGMRALVQLARRHRGLGADLSHRDLNEIVQLSLDIASAAGTLWNQTHNIAPEEEVAFSVIAEFLAIDDGETWQELIEDLSNPDAPPDEDYPTVP